MASPADSSDLYKSQIRDIAGQTSDSPIWRTIPVQNWTTGDVIAFDLAPYVISPDGSPITFAELGDNIPSALTLFSGGAIAGTIDSLQGGTYEIVVTATNSTGTPISNILPAVLVGLEITAPILDTIPDVTYEVGTLIDPINLSDYLLDDGNPAGIETISWTLTGFPYDPLPLDVSLAGSTGIASGSVGLSVTPEALSIGVIATNSSLPSDIEPFTFTVSAAITAVEIPVFGELFSGELGCAVANVVPTWSASTNFFVNELQTITTGLQMLSFIASPGSSAVTDIELVAASPLLPDNLVLDTDGTGGAGIGFITGIVAVDEAVNYGAEDLVFRASNDGGITWSANSGIFTMTVQDPTAVVPTLDSIDGAAGTNDVYVNFSEPVETNNLPTQAASYELGFAFTVNGAARNHTFVSGAGTNRIRFSLDGLALSGNNTIGLVFTA